MFFISGLYDGNSFSLLELKDNLNEKKAKEKDHKNIFKKIGKYFNC